MTVMVNQADSPKGFTLKSWDTRRNREIWSVPSVFYKLSLSITFIRAAASRGHGKPHPAWHRNV